MGDFNAKIGVAKKEEYLVSKQFGFGNRNEKGYRLVHFALEHNLTIINTCFEKKPWTIFYQTSLKSSKILAI